MHFIPVVRLLAVAAALFAEMAWAGGGPPMITDDPGTPGNGNWEINLAAVTSRTAGETDAELPLADFNYGVGERLQLKFEMPWAVQDRGGSYRSGAGNALAGVKWRFYDGGENAWQVSTYPQIEFRTPVSSFTHANLADSGTSHLVPLQFMRTFKGFDINFDIGRWFRPGARPDTWTAGFALTREVRKGFELIAEVHEEMAVHQSQEELILNFGARYDFSPRYTLLLSAGRDLRNTLAGTNTLLSYIGLQVHY
ncbi:MAG TPA: hypothetical protein VH105_19015 [Burkholderiales bacterium]|jgi:hypothetical protein|nr:hypothetical protein [Burkholderiales bacterium]